LKSVRCPFKRYSYFRKDIIYFLKTLSFASLLDITTKERMWTPCYFFLLPKVYWVLKGLFLPVRFFLFYCLNVEKKAVYFLHPDRTPVFFSDDLRNDQACFIMSWKYNCSSVIVRPTLSRHPVLRGCRCFNLLSHIFCKTNQH